MMYKTKVTVCSAVHSKHINANQYAEFCNFKPGVK